VSPTRRVTRPLSVDKCHLAKWRPTPAPASTRLTHQPQFGTGYPPQPSLLGTMIPPTQVQKHGLEEVDRTPFDLQQTRAYTSVQTMHRGNFNGNMVTAAPEDTWVDASRTRRKGRKIGARILDFGVAATNGRDFKSLGCRGRETRLWTDPSSTGSALYRLRWPREGGRPKAI
jgi:hypothetical protein